MLDVQAALQAAGVPAFRAGYRRGGAEQMPGQYVVYAVERAPDCFFDDAAHVMHHAPTLRLYSRGSPAALAAAIEAAMTAEGFCLVRSEEAYEKNADLYEIETQWEAEEALC